MHDVIIRGAVADDAPALARLAGELGYPSTAEEIRARFVALGSEHAVFVATEDDAVIGWIHMSAVLSVVSDPRAQIRALVVAETHRGGGIGARLVAAGESWARARGLGEIHVYTNVTRERTHRFYERLGFVLKKNSRIYVK